MRGTVDIEVTEHSIIQRFAHGARNLQRSSEKKVSRDLLRDDTVDMHIGARCLAYPERFVGSFQDEPNPFLPSELVLKLLRQFCDEHTAPVGRKNIKEDKNDFFYLKGTTPDLVEAVAFANIFNLRKYLQSKLAQYCMYSYCATVNT